MTHAEAYERLSTIVQSDHEIVEIRLHQETHASVFGGTTPSFQIHGLAAPQGLVAVNLNSQVPPGVLQLQKRDGSCSQTHLEEAADA